MFNYAVKEGLVRENPANKADLTPIRKRKPRKPPLDLDGVERAASVLQGRDRVYFDFIRFTGLRKDETNLVTWDDVDLKRGWLHVPGSKTEESDDYIPLAPVLFNQLVWLHNTNEESDYLFPGNSARIVGKKIYSRRRLFEKIERLTSSCRDCGGKQIGRRRYCESCHRVESISRVHRCSKCKSGSVQESVGCLTCGSGNIQPGVKLRPKDMRDYFASEVASRVTDPNVAMRLLRHTSLTTTTKYLRTVKDRMQDAVRNLGGEPTTPRLKKLGANPGANYDLKRHFSESRKCRDKHSKNKRTIGGGGQIRTVDAADMSRVL